PGISRFSGAQLRTVVRCFASPRNDGSLPTPVTPAVTAAADIGHPHQLRDHAHQLAAASAAEHAHVVAAVTATNAGWNAAAKATGDSAATHHAAEATAAAFHHAAHHRAHGLHHHGEAALAHLRLHHFQHRRHLRHHVFAAATAAETRKLRLCGHRRQRKQQQQRGCVAHHLVSSSHGSVPHALAAAGATPFG